MNATYGLDPAELLRWVIRPTLGGLYSKRFLGGPIAEALVLGTGMVESNLRHIDQVDKANKPGPAYGLFQMERATHDDVWKNWLKARTDLAASVRALGRATPDVTDLITNLAYATAMTRIHYLRVPQAIPSFNAIELALYHKKFYNTVMGDTKLEISMKYFQDAITVVQSTQ